MKNHRHREQGFTLLEVLAASTLLTFVLGAVFMLITAVNFQWNSSTQKFTDDNQTTLTMDTLTKNLVTASRGIFIGENEFRFRTEKVYKAVVWNGNSLTLYAFGSGNAAMDSTNFQNPSIQWSNHPHLYSAPQGLSDQVERFGLRVWDGASYLFMPGTVYKRGELLKVSVQFRNSRVDVWGNKSTVPVTKTATVKLLQDH